MSAAWVGFEGALAGSAWSAPSYRVSDYPGEGNSTREEGRIPSLAWRGVRDQAPLGLAAALFFRTSPGPRRMAGALSPP
jgi:hypothetical protein